MGVSLKGVTPMVMDRSRSMKCNAHCISFITMESRNNQLSV
ncbi:MAG: hypothetical protein ACI8ZW_001415 [Yoonia sp.]